MKNICFFFTALLFVLISCNKADSLQLNEEIKSPESLIPKSFSVTSPQTKTSINGLNVIWSNSDKIWVIGVNGNGKGNAHEFSISTGAGTGSATFTGSVGSDEIAFYALYPYTNTTPSYNNEGIITSECFTPEQVATAGSFDPNAAEMIAIADSDDNLSFTHGRLYFKFIMGSDNVSSVKFESSGSNLSAKGKYNTISNCSISGTGGNQAKITELKGAFVKGQTYYVAIAPHKNAIGTLTVTYTFENGKTPSIRTSAFSSIKPVEHIGEVFDLGTIAISTEPVISILKPIISDIDYTEQSSIHTSSVYLLKNCEDSEVNVNVDGTVVTSATLSNGDLYFSVSANTTNDIRTGSISLKIGSNDPEVITVKQLYNGASSSIKEYWLYYGSSADLTNTGDYFTLYNVSKETLSSTIGGATSFTIENISCTNFMYLDAGSDYIQFTTSKDVIAELTYYYIATAAGDANGTRIKVSESGTAINTTTNGDVSFGSYTQKSISGLSAEKTYKIQRDNKKPGILIVKVTETPVE